MNFLKKITASLNPTWMSVIISIIIPISVWFSSIKIEKAQLKNLTFLEQTRNFPNLSFGSASLVKTKYLEGNEPGIKIRPSIKNVGNLPVKVHVDYFVFSVCKDEVMKPIVIYSSPNINKIYNFKEDISIKTIKFTQEFLIWPQSDSDQSWIINFGKKLLENQSELVKVGLITVGYRYYLDRRFTDSIEDYQRIMLNNEGTYGYSYDSSSFKKVEHCKGNGYEFASFK